MSYNASRLRSLRARRREAALPSSRARMALGALGFGALLGTAILPLVLSLSLCVERRTLLLVTALSGLVALALLAFAAALRRSLRARERLGAELAERRAEVERESRERRSAEELLEYYRDYDRLTGLPNRESFVRGLSAAIQAAGRRGRFLAVLSLGLDRFERVNEARGHAIGDKVLIQAASSLRSSFREDDLLARFGDDRFAVLCADVTSAEDVKELIAKAQKAFLSPFPAGEGSQRLAVSVGLALFPNDGLEPSALLQAAETALRLAEEDGPGRYRLFDPRLQAELVDRLRLEAELGAAVQKSAFEPWFQPKVDRTGRIVGAEALARWPLSDGSVRVPAGFVAAAERSGDIAGLGRIILGKACERAARWERDGLPAIPISVNLSPQQFASPSLVMEVRTALADSGLSPYRLELEVTESGLGVDEEAAIDLLASLKALGVSLSIDDFGTGYSSIAKLRDYPIDAVKLPRELVAPLPGDPRASMIAEAIIELAHKLRFGVVAEGVETREQLAWLELSGCDLYQGFLFSPPLPDLAFEVALARGFAAVVQ